MVGRRRGGLRLLRPYRRAWGDGRGDPPQPPPARDRRRRLHLPTRAEPAPAHRRRRQRLHRRRRSAAPDPAHRPGLGKKKQADRLAATRARRDGAEVEKALAELKRAAATEENLMPPIIAAARACASEGR